jgi:hypothetical protein
MMVKLELNSKGGKGSKIWLNWSIEYQPLPAMPMSTPGGTNINVYNQSNRTFKSTSSTNAKNVLIIDFVEAARGQLTATLIKGSVEKSIYLCR